MIHKQTLSSLFYFFKVLSKGSSTKKKKFLTIISYDKLYRVNKEVKPPYKEWNTATVSTDLVLSGFSTSLSW